MGSPYANLDTSGSSAKSPYANLTPGGPSGGGGVLGAIGGAAHWAASKASLAGHDIAQTPGQLYRFGKLVPQQVYDDVRYGPHSKQAEANFNQAVSQSKGMIESSKEAIQHPGRDPFQTFTLVAPFLHLPFRGAELARGTDITAPRLLKTGDVEHNLSPPSRSATGRAVQKVYDKTLQSALDKNAAGDEGRISGRVAAHAMKRVGKQQLEAERPRQQMRDSVAADTEFAGRKMGGGRIRAAAGLTKVPRRVQEDALRLLIENRSPEGARDLHLSQARQGVERKANMGLARRYATVIKHGLLTSDQHGNVVADAEKFPKFADVATKALSASDKSEGIIREFRLMTDEGLRSRKNAPGMVQSGARYESPTPGKLGKPSQGLIRARAYADRVGSLVDRAEMRVAKHGSTDELLGGGLYGGRENLVVRNLKAAHSAALDEVQRLENAAARRQKPTGFVGATGANEGRGFVSYKVTEAKGPKTAVARAASEVVGEPRSPLTKDPFTAEGMLRGKVPDNTTRLVAQHLRNLNRFVNTRELRDRWLESGADVRRSNRDILVREPGTDKGKIPLSIEELLGKKTSTLDETVGTEKGLKESVQHYFDHLLGRDDPTVLAENRYGIGEKAPEGYRWVDRNVLGDYEKSFSGSRGRVGRFMDNTNSLITAGTVYFKVGHLGTRYLTNAATGIVEGSATPLQIFRYTRPLWKELSWQDRLRALAASGQHSFTAMPHEGTGWAGRAATTGANWWARHADAPFRFNAIAYEARKAGFDTPAKFREFLGKLENPDGLSSEERARVENVAKRANRENISYDRLNETERRFITRAFWFYPWVKGSTAFTFRTLLEHPYKSAAVGQLGAEGRKQTQAELGDLPSYEQGLFKLFGQNDDPTVANFSTFSPFSTAADLLQIPEFKAPAENLNPAAAALLGLATRTNQYGQHSNSPFVDALKQLLSPTPEYQLGRAFSGHQSKMFPGHDVRDAILGALLGPAKPRNYSPSVGQGAAQRERQGR